MPPDTQRGYISMGNILFQNALKNQNKDRPPIWFMRQAGRYHSHYQELKKLNLKLLNPLTGEISIPVVEKGTKKDHRWSLIEKKK